MMRIYSNQVYGSERRERVSCNQEVEGLPIDSMLELDLLTVSTLGIVALDLIYLDRIGFIWM